MAAEQQDRLLQLFDLHWFKRQILTNPSLSKPNPPYPNIDPTHKPPSFKPMRSFSDQSLSSKPLVNGAASPNSVLIGEESDESPGKKKKNKSLSELEFEELKGFMDLGFLFEEESLEIVKILPGLQRLRGMKSGDDCEAAIDGEDEAQMRVFSRPYLSEAWEVLEMNRRKKEGDKTPLMKKMKKEWRLPSVRSEDDMKQHLRMWAQAVASAIR